MKRFFQYLKGVAYWLNGSSSSAHSLQRVRELAPEDFRLVERPMLK